MAQYQFNPFTNNLDLVGTSGGGSGITTIDLDSGSITGSTVTLSGGTSGLTTSAVSGTEGDIVGTLNVSHGGTGDASFTAYSVITGGTTSTGALQNVSGVGTSGQVLTSNGAAALPSWQTAPSSLPQAFSAYFESDVSNVTGDGTAYVLAPTGVLVSNGYSYDTSSGEITITNTGIYFISISLQISGIEADQVWGQWQVRVGAGQVGGGAITNFYTAADFNDQFEPVWNTTLSFTASDVVTLIFRVIGGSKSINVLQNGQNASSMTLIRIG